MQEQGLTRPRRLKPVTLLKLFAIMRFCHIHQRAKRNLCAGYPFLSTQVHQVGYQILNRRVRVIASAIEPDTPGEYP